MMNLDDGLLVVIIAFLSGMGNNVAKELFDWAKAKRKRYLPTVEKKND